MGILIATLTAIGGTIVVIMLSATGRQVSDEFKAWTPHLAAKLVHSAVFVLPAEERERFAEEWLSHIDEIPGEVGKLVAAVGFIIAARRIARICVQALPWCLLLFPTFKIERAMLGAYTCGMWSVMQHSSADEGGFATITSLTNDVSYIFLVRVRVLLVRNKLMSRRMDYKNAFGVQARKILGRTKDILSRTAA
jgi:hypothetical protein